MAVAASGAVEYWLRFTRIGCFVADAGVALIAGAAAIGRRTAAAHAQCAGFAHGAELTVVAGRAVNHGLWFAHVGCFVADAGVALIAGAAAISGRTTAADTRGAGFARRAELTVVAAQSLVDGRGLARAGTGVAHADITCVVQGGTIDRRSSAYAARTDVAGGAEVAVIAREAFVGRLRLACISGFVANAEDTLIV